MNELHQVLKVYRRMLNDVDRWFAGCLQAASPGQLACRSGCSACCRALFDITLLDAWVLKDALTGLPEATQHVVLARCRPRLVELQERWPMLRQPFLLNGLPEDEWADTPEDDQTPCPLIDEHGRCLVYASRPMTCRLHGLPNIDYSGEDFEGTVCTLHRGDPSALPGKVLRWRFREQFAAEAALFREFTRILTGHAVAEWDTYIPLALLADYTQVDWGTMTAED